MMMEEQKAMLENTDTMKAVFQTITSTNEVIKQTGKDLNIETIEKAREDMQDIKDQQAEMNDLFKEYAEEGNEEVDEELENLEKEIADQEVNLPAANKEEVIAEPPQKDNIKKEEEALGDFLA